MGNRIPVPLELDDFEVDAAELVGGWLEVAVTSSFPRACHHCGSLSVIGHGRTKRRIRDCSFGHPTVLVWDQRRFRCKDCSRTCRERHPALAGQKSVTQRLRRRLFERACEQPFSQVADAEAVTGYRVLEAFEDYADWELDQPIEPPRVVSLDESSFKRRFCFYTVLSDPERGKLLGMVEGRDKRGAINALGLLEPSVRAAVQTVVIDCHWPFRQAAEAMMPGARIVTDKFHVIRSVDQAAQRVRVRVGRRPKHMVVGRDGGTARQKYPRGEPLLYRSRWVFMKRAGKLTDEDRLWLEAIFEHSPEMRLAWLIKESFAAIYDSPDRQEAERRLDTWVYNLNSCGMREFADVWRTLQWWREPILAYFDDRVTNGFAEGITNKIKVMKRMSYGFRNADRYQRKVLLMSSRRRSRGPTHRKS